MQIFLIRFSICTYKLDRATIKTRIVVCTTNKIYITCTCHSLFTEHQKILTIITEACLRLRFSSCKALTRNLYVSNSTFNTRFCCCRLSILFCSCSRVIGLGGIIIGPPSMLLESDSLAESAISV